MATLEVIESKLERMHDDIRETKEVVKKQNYRVRSLEIEQAKQGERNKLSHWLNRGIAALLAAIAGYIGFQN